MLLKRRLNTDVLLGRKVVRRHKYSPPFYGNFVHSLHRTFLRNFFRKLF